ncbi:MAG: ferritin family protein [Anaerolineae bacterium]|nr:ferritin family protein [Anaerolineae bacterium]
MDLMNVLSQALKLESDGREFYLHMAEIVEDEDGKQMFQHLADDESHHYKYIERQYEALREGRGWAPISEMGAPEELDAVSLVFPPKTAVAQVLPKNPTEEDALVFALGVEDKSFQLYYNSAQIAKDPDARMLFSQLATAEHTHFNILMQRYESRFPYPR